MTDNGRRRATKADAEAILATVAKTFGATETGPDAAYRGTGPELVKDWDWVSAPNWAIIWEGGPYDWAVEFEGDVPESCFAEPYSGWALIIWRLG